MPHIEIKYSDNLIIEFDKVFDAVEKEINDRDSSAGVCKSRAYACSTYKYSHILISISLLTKPHRNKQFTESLSKKIEKIIKGYIKQSVYFSLNIEYSLDYYTTNTFLVEGDELLTMDS